MYKVTKFPHGTFSWADVGTYDTEKGKAFYMELFGWDKDEVPMGGDMTYTMFKLDGETVAALSPMLPGAAEQGIPPAWTNYITVDDVDALVDPIKGNGGSIAHGPIDVFESGRMLVLQDPTGAHVALWQPKTHIGASVVNTPGAMMWNELATRDLETAKDFYNKILGWEYEMNNDGYVSIKNNGRYNGGMMTMDESYGEMPPVWTIYFNVEDLDASIKKVEELGGKIMVKAEASGVGPFAIINDSTGATLSIMEAKNAQAWEE
jgi:uncharacterized protein